jgi:UPF0755 protein
MIEEKKAKSGKIRKFIIALLCLLVLVLGITAFNYYLKFFGPNVTDKQEYLYIPTGSTFDDVYESIKAQEILKDTTSFAWTAENMDYTTQIKPGKYRLKPGMSNRSLVNLLKSGAQEPVRLSFRNIRLKENFAAFVAKKIEADSLSIMRLLDSTDFIERFGFTTDNVYTMFLPNTYELYWNTSAEKFFSRMNDEYNKFWTAERKAKADALQLSPAQVSILASVVDAEALHDDEMPVIAGLYLNRLRKGMRLEADPTVIFAMGDFTIKRVLNKYLLTNSPYNTYRNTGLPPGPIMMPSINAVNAVLDYASHNYIYMCAKDDFSGYHNFATTMTEHMVNARKFQKALNDRNIKK